MTSVLVACGVCEMTSVPIWQVVVDHEAETATVSCPTCGRQVTVRVPRRLGLLWVLAGAQVAVTLSECDAFADMLEFTDDLVGVLEAEGVR